MIEQPYTIKDDVKVYDAKKMMLEYGVSGLLVETEDRILDGIITNRDIIFEKNMERKVAELMTKNVITAKYGTTMEQAKEILHKHRIEKLPVVDDKKRIVDLITSKDIMKMDQYPSSSKDKKGRLLVLVVVGVEGDFFYRLYPLLALPAHPIRADT